MKRQRRRSINAAVAYQKATHVAANPNANLLDALHDAGVDVYVCGQTLAHQNLPMGALFPRVRLATAALVVLAQTQAQGYAYLPE